MKRINGSILKKSIADGSTITRLGGAFLLFLYAKLSRPLLFDGDNSDPASQLFRDNDLEWYQNYGMKKKYQSAKRPSARETPETITSVQIGS